jgi:putative ABC transport system permease protein
MAFLVESRAREIGIRIACGADRKSILWLVLSGAGRLVLMGLSLGLSGAWGVARLLMSSIARVGASEVDVYAVSVAVLCAAVLIASVVPVRRATRVDPLTVLRCE